MEAVLEIEEFLTEDVMSLKSLTLGISYRYATVKI
jgi:hypothetical protein